uniref:hypothetical protein n=1 Tax=Paractinoplanes polyasparticus TaxID=2856853 RepID=UPI001C85F532|nr:hypothetical protein [Actinoplanes polyasparticus]
MKVLTDAERAQLQLDAARVIEPYVTGTFKRQERAAGIAQSLFWSGFLRGGRDLPDARERVANDLGCRMDWPVAERAAEALERAGLLTATTEEN